jgi:NAD(P)H dehydrogenase (quinone)
VKALIVHAHPEPTSFNGRLLDTAVRTLTDEGHAVRVSDLYAMGWDPVASGDDFVERRFPGTLQYDREQKAAVSNRTFRADIAEEIEKVLWCDLLVLQFPLWWYSTPAIMKGWIDRVFANGLMYGALGRFDAGGMAGKRAMVSTTTGAFPGMVGEAGVMGHLDAILWHLEYGTLAYTGFTVVERFVANAVRYVDGPVREGYLTELASHLRRVDSLPVMSTHATAEFGEDFRLLPDVAPRTLGHSWRPL